MTIRRKTFIVISATLACLVVSLFFVSRHILQQTYSQLEENEMVEETDRAVRALGQSLDRLSRTTADWSYWNDTYEFVQGEYPDYSIDNLGANSLATIDLNFAIFVDREGEVYFSTFVDREEAVATAPTFAVDAAFLQALAPAPQDLLSQVTGIMEADGRTLLVASRHILDSQSEGPSMGTLIFGTYLDEARVATLEENLRTELSVHHVDDAGLAPYQQTIVRALGQSDRVLVQSQERSTVSGFKILNNVRGQPAFLLQATEPRTLLDPVMAALGYFFGSMLLFGVLSIGVTLLLMEHLVLARLNRLHNGVTQIRRTGDLSLTVEADGSDEIAHLGQVLNALLREVDESRQKLQNFNRELEQRVAQRTADLNETNRALRAEVSERKQTEIKLEAARDQALEALRLKAQILANVSHDVRTPLNVIILRSEMLLRVKGETLEPGQRKQLETILLSAHELLQFFNNLLEQSQSDEKALKIKRAPFCPADLFQEVQTLMQPLAEKKGLCWRGEIDPALPTTIVDDRDRVKQILSNLVDNAIKYTDDGEIEIRFEYHRPQGSAPEQWAMIVSDTGRGISPDDRDHIFDAFWQADGSLTRRVNRGVGLGLSIVKQLVLLMGGEVWVSANEGGAGSTFTVVLPLHSDLNEWREGVHE